MEEEENLQETETGKVKLEKLLGGFCELTLPKVFKCSR